ncbi:MAG: hypothetical protein HZC29_00295 [Thaumarchaeota archaeon]|nr:hypothetical protein [Nitrososphaerota archaeon]
MDHKKIVSLLFILLISTSITSIGLITQSIGQQLESEKLDYTIPDSSVAPIHNVSIDLQEKLDIKLNDRQTPAQNIERDNNKHSIALSESLRLTTDQQIITLLTAIPNYQTVQAIPDRTISSDRSKPSKGHRGALPLSGMSMELYSGTLIQVSDSLSTVDIFDDTISSYLANGKLQFVEFELSTLIPAVNIVQTTSNNTTTFFTQQSTNFLLIFFFVAFCVIVKSENLKIQIRNDSINKSVAYLSIVLIISSVLITPYSISDSYWGQAFAMESDNSTEDVPISEQIANSYNEDSNNGLTSEQVDLSSNNDISNEVFSNSSDTGLTLPDIPTNSTLPDIPTNSTLHSQTSQPTPHSQTSQPTPHSQTSQPTPHSQTSQPTPHSQL